MWKCPKCGQELKNENQDHACKERPNTIDDYIDAQAEEVQPYLRQIREVLRTALPEAQERISWGMPTYWSRHNIIHFAAFKKHLGIYPGEKAMVHFGDRLTEYKTSKGALQLPYKNSLPLMLIEEMAKWCYETVKGH